LLPTSGPISSNLRTATTFFHWYISFLSCYFVLNVDFPWKSEKV
jgi:hypothetical protein